MTGRDLAEVAAPTPARQAEFIGQATAIEQARAVAEVQAAIVVAQQVPRSIPRAMEDMREATDQMGLAERAFFKFPRSGQSITGPTVHLARELARCWGNIQYGIAELRRDDAAGLSEMQAYAWDVQTNTRSAQIFIVPHARDTKQGRTPIVELRDIYENNANNGARRVREAIFAVLPVWFTEEAKTRCAELLRTGGKGGKPLAARIADAVKAFEGIGVTVDQLEAKVSRPRSKWNEHDIADLIVTFQSIDRGELRKDDEFPQRRVTAADIAPAGPTAANGVNQATGEVPRPDDGSWPDTPEIPR